VSQSILEVSKNKILGGSISLFQPKKGFRVSIDSILLSSSIKKYSNCMEFGTGSGVILIYLSKKFPNSKIIGVEKNKELVELAKKNLLENNVNDKNTKVICNDLLCKSFLNEYNNKLDRVIMNPPYFSLNNVIKSDNKLKASARYETNINQWFLAAYKKLKPKGYMNFVFRSENLDLILSKLYGSWGDIKIFPLWPKANIRSKLMIIQARKNINSGVQILPGLILHNNDGSYTDECNSILNNKSNIQLD
jgi:tRNA1(Val) A37 N6-methylase TrmN6